MENATKIRMLQIEVDILSAQVTLLRRQLNDLRQEPPTGQKDENSICPIMQYFLKSILSHIFIL